MKKMVMILSVVFVLCVGHNCLFAAEKAIDKDKERVLSSLEILGIEESALSNLSQTDLHDIYNEALEILKKWSHEQFIDFKIKNLEKQRESDKEDNDIKMWREIRNKLLSKSPLTQEEKSKVNLLVNQYKKLLPQQIKGAYESLSRAIEIK